VLLNKEAYRTFLLSQSDILYCTLQIKSRQPIINETSVKRKLPGLTMILL